MRRKVVGETIYKTLSSRKVTELRCSVCLMVFPMQVSTLFGLAALLGMLALVALTLAKLMRRNQEIVELREALETKQSELYKIRQERSRNSVSPEENSKETEALRRQVADLKVELAERKAELEEAARASEEAARAKSLFVGNMSHELRTPLNGILGLTRSLLDTRLSSRSRNEVELIQLAGEDLIRMVNDVLDLSKLDANKVYLEKVSFQLSELVERSFGLLYPQAARKRLCYRLTYDLPVCGGYLGDPARIRQVLLNLLSNAIKFTDSGSVHLHVSSTVIDDGNWQVQFRIKDTGVGIATDKLDLIFREFQQADLSTTRRFGGTGLGLTLSRRFAELMNGAIAVESELGKGSVFCFTVPLQQSERKKADEIEAVDGTLGGLDGIRVLMHDSPTGEAHQVMEYLDIMPGLEYVTAETSDDLFRYLQTEEARSIDVVVTSASIAAGWDRDKLQVIAQMGVSAPSIVLIHRYLEDTHPIKIPGGRTLDYFPPFLPSEFARTLRKAKREPLGPLFEAVGISAPALFPMEDQQSSGVLALSQHAVILAHRNPVELRRLEGMAKKLDMASYTAATSMELLELLNTATYAALVTEASLLSTDVQSAIATLGTNGRKAPHLLIAGKMEALVRTQLSTMGISFLSLPETPRLAQLKEALTKRLDVSDLRKSVPLNTDAMPALFRQMEGDTPEESSAETGETDTATSPSHLDRT